MQTDMTDRALMEAALAQVSEAQLDMLTNIFPRHILNFLTENNSPELLGKIAKAHDEVGWGVEPTPLGIFPFLLLV